MITRNFLLPDYGVPKDEDDDEHRGRWLVDLQVGAKSPAIGKRGSEVLPLDTGDAYLVEIYRNGQILPRPRAATVEVGDHLLVRGGWKDIRKVMKSLKLEFDMVAADLIGDPDAEHVLGEVLIAPGSQLVGRTLSELRFGHAWRVRVRGLQRPGTPLRQPIQHTPLQVGDTLLVNGTPEAMDRLSHQPGLVLIREHQVARIDAKRAVLSVGIMACTVLLAAFGVMPIVASALLGCVALVILHVLRPEQAYAGIDWRVIVMLAGVLPLGIALQNSGGADWIARHAMSSTDGGGPVLTLAVIYLLTAVMTELMSNNASAVLIAPIAIATAETMGVDAKPFLVAVAFAASTSFATPVGYQTNTMVYTAGGYHFTDFLRIGLPLNLLFFGMAVVLIPRYFPF